MDIASKWFTLHYILADRDLSHFFPVSHKYNIIDLFCINDVGEYFIRDIWLKCGLP